MKTQYIATYTAFSLCALLACDFEPASTGPSTGPKTGKSDAAVALCVKSSECPPGFECRSGICQMLLPDSGIQERIDGGTESGKISADQQFLDFGAATFGATTVRQVTITNTGKGVLKLLEVFIREDPLGEFEPVFGGTLPTTLEPDERVGILVGYTPQDNTDDHAKLVFVSDDPDTVLLEIPMSSEFKGIADLTIVDNPQDTQPEITQIDFGDVPLRGSRRKTIYMKNVGTGANPLLAILDTRLDPSPSSHFTIASSTNTPTYLNRFKTEALCDQSTMCPSGHTCDQQGLCRPLIELFEVIITFEPLTLGSIRERLVVSSKQGGTGQQQETTIIELIGQGTQANLFLDPETIDLGRVFVGTIGMAAFELSNTGGADLTVTQLSISGGSEFSLDLGAQSVPINIIPGASVSTNVRYQPTQAGVVHEMVTIHSTDNEDPVRQIVVTGTASFAPVIQTPIRVDFGEIHVVRPAAAAALATINVENTGGFELLVSRIEFAASGSPAFSTMPMSLAPIAPGQGASFDVQYSPAVVGSDTANLVLTTNDPQRTQVQIALEGSAIDPTITVTPTGAIDLGTILPTATSTLQNLLIENTGIGPLIVTAIGFTAGSSPDFLLSAVPPLPQTLLPTETLSFATQYTPTTVGPDTAAIEILSSDLDSTVVFRNLYGQGSECQPNTWDIDLDPSNGCEYSCVPASPPLETCNQQDDNCDGAVDEGFQLGAACTGRGQCGAGIFECHVTDPNRSNCSTNGGQSASQAQVETCDNTDEDCNGIIDNGFNLAQSLVHCGLCNNPCTVANGVPECVSGVCRIQSCTTGFRDCDLIALNGCERDIRSDINHCSACNSVCAPPNATALCNNGTCEIDQCDAGFSDCDMSSNNGCEVETRSSINDCGSCGDACIIPNGTPICRSGVCEIGACDPGFGDCDGFVSNGCEQSLDTLVHCGACNQACTAQNASTQCNAGSCQIGACDPGFGDCDSSVINGCETPIDTPLNCGACNQICGVNSLCCGQSCRTASSQDCGTCDRTCSAGLLVATEAMINPDMVPDQQGEWIELYNTSTRAIDIRGFRLSDLGSDSHIITSATPVIVAPLGLILLGRNANESTNGGAIVGYQYSSFILGNSGDEIIISAFGTEIDRVVYTASFDPTGASTQLSQNQFDATANDDLTLWCASSAVMSGGDLGSPGGANLICP
jgi:hypothetical protein